jgi:hypothetical protein
MNRHVPAFQDEASVRCQVRGTEAEVKAKREKTVNRWLTAVIFWGEGGEREREPMGGENRRENTERGGASTSPTL